MPESIAFYCDVLGFEVVKTSQPGDEFDWALLRLDDAELMLKTAHGPQERPQAPDPSSAAAHGDTGLFFGCRDLDAAIHTSVRGVSM